MRCLPLLFLFACGGVTPGQHESACLFFDAHGNKCVDVPDPNAESVDADLPPTDPMDAVDIATELGQEPCSPGYCINVARCAQIANDQPTEAKVSTSTDDPRQAVMMLDGCMDFVGACRLVIITGTMTAQFDLAVSQPNFPGSQFDLAHQQIGRAPGGSTFEITAFQR